MSGSRWELVLVRRGDSGWTEGPIVRDKDVVWLVARLIVYEAAPIDGVLHIETVKDQRIALLRIDQLQDACSRIGAYLRAVGREVARVHHDTPAEWFDASMLADRSLVSEADFADKLAKR